MIFGPFDEEETRSREGVRGRVEGEDSTRDCRDDEADDREDITAVSERAYSTLEASGESKRESRSPVCDRC